MKSFGATETWVVEEIQIFTKENMTQYSGIQNLKATRQMKSEEAIFLTKLLKCMAGTLRTEN